MFKAIATFFNNINDQAAQYEMKVADRQFETVEDAYKAGCEENKVFGAAMVAGKAVGTVLAVQGAQVIADELF